MIARYVTSTYEIADAYKEILLCAKEAKVKIEPSDDNSTKIAFFEKKKRPFEFFVEDGILTIKSTKSKWYHALKIGIDKSEIKLSIPKSMLEAISVNSNVGHVDISSITCKGTITVQTNTGKINLENICCKNLNSKGNTGAVSLNKIVAQDSIVIKRNTGKVLLNDCTSPDIFVKCNTGGVYGKLPSNTAFTVSTKTGKIQIPKPPVGEAIVGRCEIKTNTGKIIFE